MLGVEYYWWVCYGVGMEYNYKSLYNRPTERYKIMRDLLLSYGLFVLGLIGVAYTFSKIADLMAVL